MKKLLLFLLLIPALINAQSGETGIASSIYPRQPLSGGNLTYILNKAYTPSITTPDTIYLSDPSDKRHHLLVDMGGGEYSAVIVTKITIGKVPAVLYMPSDFDSGKKYPVFLFLHGLSEMSKDKPEPDRVVNNGNHAALLAAAEKYKFVVVAPQLVQSFNDWIPGWTNKYLQPVYDFITGNSFTDLSHIVVTGLSLGGGGTWVASTGPFAQYISAAIPICGTPQYDQDYSQIGKHNIPVWAFHAKDDKTVNVVATINTIAAINKFSPTVPPIFTQSNTGGHGIWGTVYSTQDVYTWALSQSNGAPVITPPDPPVPVDEVISTYKVVVYKSGKVEVVKQ